jgi:hypothetical protein
MFLFYRNFFGMKRLFERPFFPGYFTHFDYVTPRYDLAGYLQGGPRYDPMKSIAEGLTRQPLEKSRNDFAGLIRRMEAAPQEEFNPLVDKDVNSVVPLMLAFGWFDPAGPEARWEDLPPSALFDGEGAAAMKSGWDEDMTDVYFVSGLRDVAYRVQPNDFQIFKAGRMLVGTAAHQGDHGNPVSCWGNVVVAGDRWTERWGQKHHARFDERKVMNRFAPETLGYALSDYRLSGFMHSSYNWFFSGGHGYGYYALTLHSHTRHPFMKDGQVLAYETWPSFDYVAGEAANAWPLEQVSEMGRQLVFIRPDVVVLYDRVKLGPKGGETAWIAAVAEKMTLGRDSFTVENDKARLLAEVLMPAQGTVDKLDLAGKYPVGGRNKYVKITPDSQGDMVEYLVVMQTGISQVEPLRPALDRNDKTTSVSFAYGEKKVAVAFNRSGEVGGRIAIKEGRNAFTHDFAERIDDSYHNWKGHRLYEKWTTDPAFRFVVKE